MSGGFRFKQFAIEQDRCAMKVGTDGVLLGAWAEGGQRVLDIGTGTGVVALMMAQRFPEATVTAVELDTAAAQQAQENAAASPFAERITVVQGDIRNEELGMKDEELRIRNRNEELQSNASTDQLNSSIFTFPSSLKFDAITCNPPYYEHTLPSRSQQRDMARSTETLTMASLMTAVQRLIMPEGTLSLVLPTAVQAHAEAEAALQGFYVKRRTLVKTVERKEPKRVLIAFTPMRPETLHEETVVLQAADGMRSEWYHQLTRDFYL